MQQPEMSLWQGRDDTASEGSAALRWHQRVQPWHVDAAEGFTVLGFACDEGVRRNQGRVGAAAAPVAIRQALASMAWHQACPLYDAGDVRCTDEALEAAQIALGMAVKVELEHRQKPLIIGGGHETAWGTFLGLQNYYNKNRIGIINLDAHFDLRINPIAHSGTPFAQMADWCKQHHHDFHYFCMGIAEAANTQALFQRAQRLSVEWMTDEELNLSSMEVITQRLNGFINKVDIIYLSIDLDLLPASIMRAVSAPAGYGVPLARVMKLIETMAQSGKLLVTDVVEFNPRFDLDQNGVRTAARLIWHLTRHWIVQPRGKA